MSKFTNWLLGTPETAVETPEEERSLENPSVDLVEALTWGTNTPSGVRVSETKSLSYVPVYAAVRVLAESVGSLPFHVYQKNGRNKVAINDPRARILDLDPNPDMTAFELWETVMGNLLLWGNAYIYKEINRVTGVTTALYPLRPDQTRPVRNEKTGEKAYITLAADGTQQGFLADEVIHIKAFSTTGDLGMSPIGQARASIGTAIAAEDYAGKFFSNSAQPHGVIITNDKLTDEQYKTFVKRWNSSHQGTKNSSLVGVLSNATWQNVSVNARDAQFLESRKYHVREIARLFRVPPHMIGDLEGTVTFASIEQQSIDFVTYSLRPWLTRIEQAVNKSLFNSEIDRKRGIYAEFKIDALLRGDTKTRYEAHAIARQNGWLSVNDIRELENLPLIEGGDDYLTPLNMAPASDPSPTDPAQDPPATEPDKTTNGTS